MNIFIGIILFNIAVIIIIGLMSFVFSRLIDVLLSLRKNAENKPRKISSFWMIFITLLSLYLAFAGIVVVFGEYTNCACNTQPLDETTLRYIT